MTHGVKLKFKLFSLVLLISFLYLQLASATNSAAYNSAFSGFDYTPVAKPTGLNACIDKTKQGLKNPGILNITVVFGYSDLTDLHFDLVTDAITLNSLNRNLTNLCVYKGQGFCEFKLINGSEHQINQYTRDLITSDGQTLTVNIFAMNSSYSNGNDDNLNKYKELQDEQTQTARDFYAWSLQNADMVFYEGHSRDGGGPDFAPPRPSRSGSVNYPWYRANKPGLKFLLASLDSSQDKPTTVGLFSCASRRHFLTSLKQHSPNSKFILSTRVVESGKTKVALMRTLESVLNFECDSDLKARINSASFVVE